MEENTSGEVSSEPKFCINCAYIGTTGSKDISQYKCFAPQNEFKRNLIDGSKHYLNPLCYDIRYSEFYCGKNGNWYVQAPVKPVYIPVTPLYTPVNQANKKPPAIDLADLLGM